MNKLLSPVRRSMTVLSVIILCLLISVGFSSPVQAQSEQQVNARLDSLFGEHEPYRTFLEKFKEAVVSGDKKKVATMIHYPLNVFAQKASKIRSRKELLSKYDKVFTKDIIAAVQRQHYADLFVRDQGVMIGDGEVWFRGLCADKACKRRTVKVITINQP
ncbi:MAG TPA: hypothetical protein VIP51_06015 [Eoetvoesiella sp.]